MCFFITLAARLPQSEWQSLERGLHEVRLAPANEPAIRAALPAGWVTMYALKTALCSCGLYHEPRAAAESEERAAAALERKRRKYERLGWTKSKIERAMTTLKRAQRGLDARVVDLVRQLCAKTGSAALLVHWGHDPVGSAAIKSSTQCELEQLSEQAGRLAVDELLLVRQSQ